MSKNGLTPKQETEIEALVTKQANGPINYVKVTDSWTLEALTAAIERLHEMNANPAAYPDAINHLVALEEIYTARISKATLGWSKKTFWATVIIGVVVVLLTIVGIIVSVRS